MATKPAESTGERQSAAERIAAKRAAKAAEKAARRGTATIPGRAGSAWARIVSRFDAHRREIVTGVASVAFLGAAGAGAAFYFEGRAHAAGNGLWTAVETVGARIVAEGETPPENALGESFPSAKARAEKALERYRAARANASSETGAWLALGEAHALYDLGKYDEARKMFAHAQELGKGDAFVTARAIEGLAVSFEAKEDHAQAMRQYEALSALGDAGSRLVGTYHRARLLAAQGKRKEALELLDTVLASNPAKPEDAKGLASVRDAAQRLRDEIAVALDLPRLRAELPTQSFHGGGATTPETQKIIEALQKQLDEQLGNTGKPAPEPSE